MTLMTLLPSPNQLLSIPDSTAFSSWYEGQDKAASRILRWLAAEDSPKFLCASLPTGSGKSILTALGSVMSKKRTAVLTATKALQDQFLGDFEQLGYQDMRGQNAYQCQYLPKSGISVDQGPCHARFRCPLRQSGCDYYDQLAIASKNRYVVTNYAYWLAQHPLPPGQNLGNRELMVMDEADQAFGALESYLTAHITLEECRVAGVSMPDTQSRPDTWEGWQEWAHEWFPVVDAQMPSPNEWTHEAPSRAKVQEMKTIQGLHIKLARLRGSRGEWVWESTTGGRRGGGFGMEFVPVEAWPVR